MAKTLCAVVKHLPRLVHCCPLHQQYTSLLRSSLPAVTLIQTSSFHCTGVAPTNYYIHHGRLPSHTSCRTSNQRIVQMQLFLDTCVPRELCVTARSQSTRALSSGVVQAKSSKRNYIPRGRIVCSQLLHRCVLISCTVDTLCHFSTSLVHQAGHNKWSKVKHIKGPKDAERSIMFNKLILQMKLAIREHGPNPEHNSQLASLMALAKMKAMPKSTMEGVLQKATKPQGVDADIHMVLEARGPGQSCLVVDVLTDNARRTRLEIQKILTKNGGEFATTLYAFKHKGVVRVIPQVESQEDPMTLDLATEVAIEVGAEDVQETINEEDNLIFMFICEVGDLRAVRTSLSSLNYCIESSSLEYLPEILSTTPLTDANLEKAYHLITALNDHPSVIKVYDDIPSPV